MLVAAALLTAAGILLTLRAVAVIALAAADGRVSGSYGIGSVVGLVVAGVIPLLLGRGLRLRQPRIRLWTIVASAVVLLSSLAAPLGGRTGMAQVVGVVAVVGAATVVVLVSLSESRRWFRGA